MWLAPDPVKLARPQRPRYSERMQETSNSLFSQRQVVVGVGGGIAAFKAAHLVSQLRQRGARVRVILTRAGAKFVTPLTFEALSHAPVLQDLFAEAPLDHVRLAHQADVFVVAPATFGLIGKLAAGLADDYLTATLAATRKPVLLCPAMEANMLDHPIFKDNLGKLSALENYHVLPPDSGALASGRSGMGRLPDPQRILDALSPLLEGGPLSGKRILVTAGPTRERIDPMRVISNRSSGKMGFALAGAARDLGAQVTLIAGPTQLPAPAGLAVVRVESAQDMFKAVTAQAAQFDWIVMAAAVADWTPKAPSKHKQDKRKAPAMALELAPTKDILKHLGQHKTEGQVLVGFAAETRDVVQRAQQKLTAKNADFFVANDVSKAAEAEQNAVTLLCKNGDRQAFPWMEKTQLARCLLEAIAAKCS